MSAAEVIVKMNLLGIEWQPEGRELKLKATKTPISQPLLAEIREHKAELLELATLRNEMLSLNKRWQDALKLEQDGAFVGKSESYLDKIFSELCGINVRADEIWSTLKAINSSLLDGLDHLEPSTDG